MARLEKDLRKEVLEYLNKHRIFHFRLEDPNLSNYPDLVLCYNGNFIGIELKRNEHTEARAGQSAVLNEIRIAGGYGAVVGSLEQLIDVLHVVDKVSNMEVKYIV